VGNYGHVQSHNKRTDFLHIFICLDLKLRWNRDEANICGIETHMREKGLESLYLKKPFGQLTFPFHIKSWQLKVLL